MCMYLTAGRSRSHFIVTRSSDWSVRVCLQHIFNDITCAKTLYHPFVSDHFVMAILAFLQRLHPFAEKAKKEPLWFDSEMRGKRLHKSFIPVP